MKNHLIKKIMFVFIIFFIIGTGFSSPIELNIQKNIIFNLNQQEILDEWNINITLDPKYPDGENNWYVSCVNLTISYDNETVKHVFVNGEIYISPIRFCEEGIFLIKIDAEDWQGNQMPTISFEIGIDYSKPLLDCGFWLSDEGLELYYVISDNVSGISVIEIYIGSTLEKINPEPPYCYTIPWDIINTYHIYDSFFKFVCYDNAGNKITCYPLKNKSSFVFIGIISETNLMKKYLGFHANLIYSPNFGIIRSQDFEFLVDRYFGIIGRNIIIAKIWGWQPTI